MKTHIQRFDQYLTEIVNRLSTRDAAERIIAKLAGKYGLKFVKKYSFWGAEWPTEGDSDEVIEDDNNAEYRALDFYLYRDSNNKPFAIIDRSKGSSDEVDGAKHGFFQFTTIEHESFPQFQAEIFRLQDASHEYEYTISQYMYYRQSLEVWIKKLLYGMKSRFSNVNHDYFDEQNGEGYPYKYVEADEHILKLFQPKEKYVSRLYSIGRGAGLVRKTRVPLAKLMAFNSYKELRRWGFEITVESNAYTEFICIYLPADAVEFKDSWHKMNRGNILQFKIAMNGAVSAAGLYGIFGSTFNQIWKGNVDEGTTMTLTQMNDALKFCLNFFLEKKDEWSKTNGGIEFINLTHDQVVDIDLSKTIDELW